MQESHSDSPSGAHDFQGAQGLEFACATAGNHRGYIGETGKVAYGPQPARIASESFNDGAPAAPAQEGKQRIVDEHQAAHSR